jgi:anti-sigma-K factor RskA
MAGVDHDALRESAGPYVLGALPEAERAAYEAHLATCAGCAAEVRALRGVVNALPYAVPQMDPPAALRGRVLAAIGGKDTARVAVPAASRGRAAVLSGGWLSAAALLLMAIALGAYAWSLRARVGALDLQLREAIARLDHSEQQLLAASTAAERAQLRLAVLLAPDLKQVNLVGQGAAPRALGRAFWSRSNGVLLTANQLPPLPAGRIYQLWFLTPGPPVSAGLITPDENGRVTAAFDTPPGTPAATGLAVSIEPEGGAPSPTGAIYLAGLSR